MKQSPHIDMIDVATEVRDLCDILWDLDTVLLEYLGPPGSPLRAGSARIHLSMLSIRHILQMEIRELLSQIEKKSVDNHA